MAEKQQIITGVVVILIFMVIFYILIARPFARRKLPRHAVPERKRAETLQILECYPSSGLAWSKKTYPEQYAAANWKTSQFVGVDDFENERFLDIGGRAYSRRVLDNFSYTDPDAARPNLRVEYLPRAEAFAGRVIGSGLKPNFAYQLKLRGIYAADREAFERIGYVGRWRLPGRGTNYRDKSYEEFEDKHLVEAYILFDFMVTDPAGNVEKEFYLDSSLHVLWSYTAQRRPTPDDTHPARFSREGGDRQLYAHPRADLSPQRVYAESESNALARRNRPPVGRAFLPPGEYVAEIVLTEESFHGWGDCGFWATVMRVPVEFEVEDKPGPPPPAWLPSKPATPPFALTRAVTADIGKEVCTDDTLKGIATSSKATVTFAEGLRLPAGKRYLFVADIFSAGSHTWQIFTDNGTGVFDERPTYSIPSTGRKGWQRFEVEITAAVAGKPTRIGLVPTTRKGIFGVRGVSVREIISLEKPDGGV